MFYVIQENVFREENYNKIFDVMRRLKLPYEILRFDQNGEFQKLLLNRRKDVFVFGSVRAARLATSMEWEPGSFYGKNHDYQVYKDFYKENLLNYDCLVKDIEDKISWEDPNEIKFIRPTKDSKIFNGGLYSRTKWDDTVEIVKKKYLGILPPVEIQIGKPKKIYKEARIWIVDGKIVTSSYYKFGDNVAYLEEVEPEAIDFAKEMVELYKVAPAFVMDVCLTPDGWKIVEINCVNCAGFYKGDLQKLVMALEYYYTTDRILF
jgi:hypothetical protein